MHAITIFLLIIFVFNLGIKSVHAEHMGISKSYNPDSKTLTVGQLKSGNQNWLVPYSENKDSLYKELAADLEYHFKPEISWIQLKKNTDGSMNLEITLTAFPPAKVIKINAYKNEWGFDKRYGLTYKAAINEPMITYKAESQSEVDISQKVLSVFNQTKKWPVEIKIDPVTDNVKLEFQVIYSYENICKNNSQKNKDLNSDCYNDTGTKNTELYNTWQSPLNTLYKQVYTYNANTNEDCNFYAQAIGDDTSKAIKELKELYDDYNDHRNDQENAKYWLKERYVTEFDPNYKLWDMVGDTEMTKYLNTDGQNKIIASQNKVNSAEEYIAKYKKMNCKDKISVSTFANPSNPVETKNVEEVEVMTDKIKIIARMIEDLQSTKHVRDKQSPCETQFKCENSLPSGIGPFICKSLCAIVDAIDFILNYAFELLGGKVGDAVGSGISDTVNSGSAGGNSGANSFPSDSRDSRGSTGSSSSTGGTSNTSGPNDPSRNAPAQNSDTSGWWNQTAPAQTNDSTSETGIYVPST